MVKRVRLLLLTSLLSCSSLSLTAADARFDLVGPRIDVRVTRSGVTLPIAAVPNLQHGDRLWIHPDLPATQSVKYLLIVCFLRGTTNPPPPEWFTRVATWDRHVREEGIFVTVPAEAQQAMLFMAPETGGDFSTLRSAVQGRPGAFVRASQDLIEAGFEQARIERYIADIRRVPPTNPAELQRHSDLLARTLALKPNADCFKRPVDTQFTCLTQSGSQIVLDDGHGQTIITALSTGSGSDLISQASYTQALGAGVYSAYVGAIVDMIRILGNLHTAQYQYIPAISSPQAEQLNLRLNTPPSFHNPKSVLVIALPSVQAAVSPPLRTADVNHVACLLEPRVTLPVEGAPLVFSTDFAHDLVLHLNTPAGAPAEADIPLLPDAYFGGLVLQQSQQHHVPLRDPLTPTVSSHPAEPNLGTAAKPTQPAPQPMPVSLTGTVLGRWGFDAFTGPTLPLQQLPGSGWHIVTPEGETSGLIAGHSLQLLLGSSGTACVRAITAQPPAAKEPLSLAFKAVVPPGTRIEPQAASDAAKPDPALPLGNVLALTLPLQREFAPGDLHLLIQQYDQPKPDELSARTFSEPATVSAVELHAGDSSLTLTGTHLDEIAQLALGDLTFTPSASSEEELTLNLVNRAAAGNTHAGEHLTAKVTLRDGRSLNAPVTVAVARPSLALLGKAANPSVPSGAAISLSAPDDLPLNASLTFTLKSSAAFPRNGQIEVETLDGTLRSVLTLAPSGGLLLQDPHTLVATLDPLRSFGPSAFGALRLRAAFPAEKAKDASISTDWLPLVTLVRLPTLTQLQCPSDLTQPCTLSGSNLFLIQSLAIDPGFESAVTVADGYTGATLSVPHPTAGTIFLRLRDDPAPIDSVSFPAATTALGNHGRRGVGKVGGVAHPQVAPPVSAPGTAAPTEGAPVTQMQASPAAKPGPSM